MSLKKKLFYSDNGVKKSETKIISIPIKTGESLISKNRKELYEGILLHKYIKNKIYPSNVVLESDPDKIYFENENVCNLLLNNRCIHSLRTPELFLKEINNLVEIIDEEIVIIAYYLPKVYFIEKEIIEVIEKLRSSDNPYWYSVFTTLSSLKDTIDDVYHKSYRKLLSLYMDLTEARHNSIFSESSILESMMTYEKIRKEYEETNKPIELKSSTFLKNIKFDNKGLLKVQKVYAFIEREYDMILDSCDIEVD